MTTTAKVWRKNAGKTQLGPYRGGQATSWMPTEQKLSAGIDSTLPIPAISEDLEEIL